MAYVVTDLRTIVRYSARNANDSLTYTDTRIDWAIQMAMQEWARITRTPRQLNQIALTAGVATVTGFPSGFLPEFALEVYLTLSGSVLEPALTISSITNALSAQVTGQPSSTVPTPPSSPPSGRPTQIAFADQTTATLDTLPDQAYTLNLYWRAPLTLWTPGSTGPTFNLPDDALLCIASRGAVWYLQGNEPANTATAKISYTEFLSQAKEFAARGAGGRGALTFYRQNPVGANGDWVR